jgi:hypothetical protein
MEKKQIIVCVSADDGQAFEGKLIHDVVVTDY